SRRADWTFAQAQPFFENYNLLPSGEIEIESALPAAMGFGSDPMHSLAAAQVLAPFYGTVNIDGDTLPDALNLPAQACEVHAYQNGGLVAVDGQGKLRRHAPILFTDDDDAWVWVLIMPVPPDGLPEDDELQQRRGLWQNKGNIDRESAFAAANQLFNAAERNEFNAFAKALTRLRAECAAAQAQSSANHDDDAAMLALLQTSGAAMQARALSGLGYYSLIHGGDASRAIRQTLVKALGYDGPEVIGVICDNEGARLRVES
ncbi:MAG: hypothetical protein KIH69_007450, partial [Anaerolineae bacterium]|nr:hypothetical protein [Anaerolineae bacterium]